MSHTVSTICIPDLSNRPFDLTVERDFALPVTTLFEAWTRRLDLWFAAPGSVLMNPEVNAPFFFEVEFKPEGQSVAQRHPHYGRFLRLVPGKLIQLTWVTGASGTEGAETVVTIELEAKGEGSHLRLTHAGFATEAAHDRHRQAWPMVLDFLEKRLLDTVAATRNWGVA
jgi:uncharacterized protein YndB with AHSA1/START domain